MYYLYIYAYVAQSTKARKQFRRTERSNFSPACVSLFSPPSDSVEFPR